MQHHKKASTTITTIIGILLVMISVSLIFGLWTRTLSKADPASSEALCEAFNAGRMISDIKPGGHKITLVPNACKTLEKTGKNSLPEEGYPQTKKGIIENQKRLITKCWDMWLKGHEEKNMFSTNLFSGKDDCFICYTTNIKKGMDIFNSNELDVSLDETIHLADDQSDKCYLSDTGYAGGYCRGTCNQDERDFPTKECETGEICCIQKDRENECIDKGGQCKLACNDQEAAYLPSQGWKCAEDNICCIDKGHVYTPRDYVQLYGGPGRIDIKPNIEFCPQGSDCADTYAVVFAAKTSSNAIPGFLENNDYNRILVYPLNEVKDICYTQSGSSGN